MTKADSMKELSDLIAMYGNDIALKQAAMPNQFLGGDEQIKSEIRAEVERVERLKQMMTQRAVMMPGQTIFYSDPSAKDPYAAAMYPDAKPPMFDHWPAYPGQPTAPRQKMYTARDAEQTINAMMQVFNERDPHRLAERASALLNENFTLKTDAALLKSDFTKHERQAALMLCEAMEAPSLGVAVHVWQERGHERQRLLMQLRGFEERLAVLEKENEALKVLRTPKTIRKERKKKARA